SQLELPVVVVPLDTFLLCARTVGANRKTTRMDRKTRSATRRQPDCEGMGMLLLCKETCRAGIRNGVAIGLTPKCQCSSVHSHAKHCRTPFFERRPICAVSRRSLRESWLDYWCRAR